MRMRKFQIDCLRQCNIASIWSVSASGISEHYLFRASRPSCAYSERVYDCTMPLRQLSLPMCVCRKNSIRPSNPGWTRRFVHQLRSRIRSTRWNQRRKNIEQRNTHSGEQCDTTCLTHFAQLRLRGMIVRSLNFLCSCHSLFQRHSSRIAE